MLCSKSIRNLYSSARYYSLISSRFTIKLFVTENITSIISYCIKYFCIRAGHAFLDLSFHYLKNLKEILGFKSIWGLFSHFTNIFCWISFVKYFLLKVFLYYIFLKTKILSSWNSITVLCQSRWRCCPNGSKLMLLNVD